MQYYDDNCEFPLDPRDLGLYRSRRALESKWVDPRRTNEKSTHPYSYSEFFLFGDRESTKGCSGDYSDRLWQWDYDKANRLWKEHCSGCRWDTAGRSRIQKFISAYHGKPLEVTGVAEGCNPSSGYPYWIVWYKDANKVD